MLIPNRLAAALFVPVALLGCATARPAADRVVSTDIVAMVEWRVERCTRAEGTVACDIGVTNRGPEGTLVIGDGDVTAFADGVRLTLQRVQWAGATVSAVNVPLPQGVPQRLSVAFGGATDAVRTIRLLEIKASVLNRNDNAFPGDEAGRPVQLRNLATR